MLFAMQKTDFHVLEMESNGAKKNQNIERIVFKAVQIKFLAMHTNKNKYVLIYLQLEIYKISS